ncbi:class I adenylate-forming enzyme family protein [Hyphomonas johnsonii]|nr:fatty acid--CoA ligase family protein [Hyphomonas johnsonii]
MKSEILLPHEGLPQRIGQSVASGGRLALSARGEELTWDDLASRVRTIEEDLTRARVMPGATVTVLGRNTISCAVAVLALICSGRCAQIVNPHVSVEGALASARALQPQAMLFEENDPVAGAALRTDPVLVLKRDGRLSWKGDVATSGAECEPRDGIIVSTSGTTGEPKPFHLTLSILSRAISEIELINAGFGDRRLSGGSWPPLIQYSPLAHIGGALTLLRAAAQGRATVILGKFHAEAWARTVEEFGLVTTGLPPSMLRMVLAAKIRPERMKTLVSVWSGTAPLRKEDRQAFSDAYDIPVLGNYGATEFCGAIAAWSLDDFRTYFASRPDAVGRINPGIAQARVRSPEGELLTGEGAVGILEFRVPRVGERWIPTSDLGCVDKEGFLTLHGRKDDAIIRGGFKLSPTKIAEVLRQHPLIHDAAVVGIADERLGQVPVAAVELERGAAIDASEIQDFVRASLPAYFVPVQVIAVDSLPRNSAMKLDRRAISGLFTHAGTPRVAQ